MTAKVKSTKSSAYKKALKADSTLAEGYEFYQCALEEDAEGLLASSGKADKNGVTFEYQVMEPVFKA